MLHPNGQPKSRQPVGDLLVPFVDPTQAFAGKAVELDYCKTPGQ
jgi:hypothetical protein